MTRTWLRSHASQSSIGLNFAFPIVPKEPPAPSLASLLVSHQHEILVIIFFLRCGQAVFHYAG